MFCHPLKFAFLLKFTKSIETSIQVTQSDGVIFPESDPDFQLNSFDSNFDFPITHNRNRRSTKDSRYFCETDQNGNFLNFYSGMGIIPIVVRSSPNTAGEMVYLGLTGNNLDHSTFRFAPTSCTFQRYNGETEPGCTKSYEIFSSNSTETCQNPYISFGLDFKDFTWRIEHMLFVIGNQAFKENGDRCDESYRLVCEVKLCTNGEENSICDQVAKNCLKDEQSKKTFLCNGKCEEDEVCEIDDDGHPICQ